MKSDRMRSHQIQKAVTGYWGRAYLWRLVVQTQRGRSADRHEDMSPGYPEQLAVLSKSIRQSTRKTYAHALMCMHEHPCAFMCQLSYLRCRVSRVMRPASCVMCHMSCVMSHVSYVICHLLCRVSCVMSCREVPYGKVPYRTGPDRTGLYRTVLCRTVQYRTHTLPRIGLRRIIPYLAASRVA